jgi:UDP-glucuronate 4-epimerase
MKVLLTGAAGFIGSHTAQHLLDRGDEVVGFDNFNSFYDPSIKRRHVEVLSASRGFSMVEADLTDSVRIEEMFSRHRFDAVIHLAAWAGVRPSIDNPDVYIESNIRGTTYILEACKKHDVMRVVFASSSSVYGGRENVPFRETEPVDRPISQYAATKKACEVLSYTYHHLYGINVSALRYFTVYGPRQRPEMAIHKFATMMSRGQAIPIYGDGSTERDYTYIDDIVQGTVRALDHCKGYEIYNLGESRTTRLDDLVRKLGKALGYEPKIRWEPNQPGDVSITCADISYARERIGYNPHVLIDEGLARFATWFHRDGVK